MVKTRKTKQELQCLKCQMQFSNKYHLKHHQLVCKELDFPCDWCDKRLASFDSRKMHHSRKHKAEILQLKAIEKKEKLLLNRVKTKYIKNIKVKEESEETVPFCKYHEYITLDIESTGVPPAQEMPEIVHIVIQAFEIDTDKITQLYNKIFNPIEDSTKIAQEVHGYTKQQLKEYPRFTKKDAADIVGILQRCSKWVSHNATGDYNFLSKQFKRVGLLQRELLQEVKPRMKCTSEMFARIFGSSKTLIKCARSLFPQEIFDEAEFHDVLIDSKFHVKLFKELIQLSQ